MTQRHAERAPGAGVRGPPTPDYLFGVALVALAGVFWSIGGVLIRWIEAADAWQIIFYRSARARADPAPDRRAAPSRPARRRLRRHRRERACSPAPACRAASSATCWRCTTRRVANAVFMLGTAPFFAAILGRWFLREDVRRATWLAMALALAGIAVMVAGSLVIGTVTGNLLALGASLSLRRLQRPAAPRPGQRHDALRRDRRRWSPPLIARRSWSPPPPTRRRASSLSARDLGLCLAMGPSRSASASPCSRSARAMFPRSSSRSCR